MSDTGNPPTTGISRTCIYTAAGRAIGARDPDPSVRNPDSLAETLLGDPSSFNITHASVRALGLSYDEAMKDLEVVNTVRTMMVRTRFIDEALERAVADGAAHVVWLPRSAPRQGPRPPRDPRDRSREADVVER